MARSVISPIDAPPPGIEWRTIQRFPDYEISEWGHVRRRIANRMKPIGSLLRPWKTKKGQRWQVMLWRGRVQWRGLLHRLVAETFIGPAQDGKPFVLHWDDNGDNNHFSNLRYGTTEENFADRARNGLNATGERNGTKKHPDKVARGERVGGAKLTEQQVREIRASELSSRLLAQSFGMSRTTIKDIRKRHIWKHVE